MNQFLAGFSHLVPLWPGMSMPAESFCCFVKWQIRIDCFQSSGFIGFWLRKLKCTFTVIHWDNHFYSFNFIHHSIQQPAIMTSHKPMVCNCENGLFNFNSDWKIAKDFARFLWVKGGLISEDFHFGSNLPNNVPENILFLSTRRYRIVFGEPFLGDLSQSEQFSEIKPPLGTIFLCF